jgi:aspartate aminotransferase-like enzyme
MMPPGLGFVAVSPKAWQAYPNAKFPRFYLDLGKYQQDAVKHSNPFTPPVNLFFALQAALQMMQAEGLEAIFDRHQRLSQALRAGLQALGFRLFAPENAASPTVTAIFPPDGVEAEAIRAVMKNRFRMMVAGGQDHLKGTILRIGHLGYVSDREILTVLGALEATLLELGYNNLRLGAGVTAAAKIMTCH